MKCVDKDNPNGQSVHNAVLFEDNHLLVVAKPAGLLTQPSGTAQPSLEAQAKQWLKARGSKAGNVFLTAIHRLDKPVSGLVLFGKTSKAVSRLNAAMRAKQIRKTYWAWTCGSFRSDAGRLEHLLTHAAFHAEAHTAAAGQGKTASLTYRVLKRISGRTLVEIELETGRYHQIRVQLAAIGHPIWGDGKYGGWPPYPEEAIALHHRFLALPHPITQQQLIFDLPPPDAFQALER